LTPHLLKSRTGEFDLESISFLDLSGMGRYKKYIVAHRTCTYSGIWIEDPCQLESWRFPFTTKYRDVKNMHICILQQRRSMPARKLEVSFSTVSPN